MRKRPPTLAQLLLLAAALVSLVLYSITLIGSSTRLRISPENFKFETPIEPLSVHKIKFTCTNNSDRPIDLIGANAFCGIDGCASILDLPKTIKAKSSKDITVEFKSASSEFFCYPVTLYTNDKLQPKIEFKIAGSIVGPDLASH